MIMAFRADLILGYALTGGNIVGIQPVTEKSLFQTDISANSTISGVISGPYFALVISSSTGYSVAGFSSDTGELLWRIDQLTDIVSLVSCSGSNFCLLDGQTVRLLHGMNGNQRWSHPGMGVTSHGTNEDYILIGDGSYLNVHLVYLVDTKMGNTLWNISLPPHTDCIDWAISPNFAFVTYLIFPSEKGNAYPSRIVALRLTDGGVVYTEVPKGDTFGQLAFFNNYDFTVLGDKQVAHYDGQTGQILCAVQNIEAYQVNTKPATSGDAFFVTYYQTGFSTQNVLRLSCP